MTSYWAELAWLGGEQPAARVTIAVDGGRITGVRPETDPPTGATVLRGLTLPGLANAHSHAFHRALRGRTHRGRGSFWTWRDLMYRVAEGLDPDRYFRLARAVYAEMLLSGYTTVGEFHYLHHGPRGRGYDDPGAMGEAVVAAAAEAGIRLTLLDTVYLHGGLGDDGYEPPNPVQQRFADTDVAAWAQRVEARRDTDWMRRGAAIHSVRAVDPSAAAVIAGWAADRELPLHAHVSEQPAENEQSHHHHGASPTEVLAAAGALSARFTAVHATHVSASDITLLGESRSAACLCPTTERDLADGIGPSVALAAAGAGICVGSDSHAVIDPFEEMRAVESHARLASGERGNHPVAELLAMATAEGHRVLGWPEGGRVEVGALADLVTVRLDSVRTVGAGDGESVSGAVFAATAADVDTVIVGGRPVVAAGHHQLVGDVAGALREAIGDL